MFGADKNTGTPQNASSLRSSSPLQTEVYNITTTGAEANASLLEKIAIEDIKELRESIIRMLSGYVLGKRPTTIETDTRIIKK